MSADFPAKNIYWLDIPVGAPVRLVTSEVAPTIPGAKPTSWYVAGDAAAVAFWGSEDAREAERSLSRWAEAGKRTSYTARPPRRK